jgi:hypothetical protein
LEIADQRVKRQWLAPALVAFVMLVTVLPVTMYLLPP